MLVDTRLFQEKQAFERIEVSRQQALEIFSDNNFKVTSTSSKKVNLSDAFVSILMDCFVAPFNQVEIINDLPEDKTITVYRCGPLVDLCRGPHIPNTSFVKAFACLKVRSYILYWSWTFHIVGYFSVILIHFNFRLHQPIGGEIKIVRVCKGFMGYLIQIKND